MPAAVLVSMGCSVAFNDAPRALRPGVTSRCRNSARVGSLSPDSRRPRPEGRRQSRATTGQSGLSLPPSLRDARASLTVPLLPVAVGLSARTTSVAEQRVAMPYPVPPTSSQSRPPTYGDMLLRSAKAIAVAVLLTFGPGHSAVAQTLNMAAAARVQHLQGARRDPKCHGAAAREWRSASASAAASYCFGRKS